MKLDVKDRARATLDPVVGFMDSTGIHPNLLTALGLVFAIIAGFSMAAGRIREGAIWLVISGIFDMLDGQVARRRGMSSRRGALLDSTLDRYAEGAVFLGLTWFYAHRPGADWTLVALVLVIVGSLLVSYVRARGEGLGATCLVGWMERPERLVVMIIACLIGPAVLPFFLWILAILSHVTVVQRIVHVYGELKE